MDEDAYINALLFDLTQDIKTYGTHLSNREIQTIFIGGGTPSLFSSKSITKLISGVKQHLNIAADAEITMEANPGSSEAGKFVGFREAGINRLSIGAQSFNSEHLQILGRIHNKQEAINAAQFATSAGFDNFNLDVMFGLPSQSLSQSLEDLQQAIALKPTHISCYQLTIEPNTLFHHNPPTTPDDDVLVEMQELLQSTLQKNQYSRYETSAYSLDNRESRHNLNYWLFGDYLGIGAGAHGKITGPEGQVHRTWKRKHPTAYLNAASESADMSGGINLIENSQLPLEFMMNALRLTNGFDLDKYEQRTNLPTSTIQKQLNQHIEQGLITVTNNKLCPTERGKLMLDSMLQDYLSE